MDFDELKRYISKTKINVGKEKNAGFQNLKPAFCR